MWNPKREIRFIQIFEHKYWVVNKVISFFLMIFKASLSIQITNINQLCIDHFVR